MTPARNGAAPAAPDDLVYQVQVREDGRWIHPTELGDSTSAPDGRRWWCYEGAWSSGGRRALPRWIDWAQIERQRRRGEAPRFKAREWASVEREARVAFGGT